MLFYPVGIEYMTSLSDEDLSRAYHEIRCWNQTGKIENEIVSSAFHEIYGQDATTPLIGIVHLFFAEMARRWICSSNYSSPETENNKPWISCKNALPPVDVLVEGRLFSNSEELSLVSKVIRLESPSKVVREAFSWKLPDEFFQTGGECNWKVREWRYLENEQPTLMKNVVHIYIRGVCKTSEREKPGEYIALITDVNGNEINTFRGKEIKTTSNRMIIVGLTKVVESLDIPTEIHFYTHCPIGLKSSGPNKELINELERLVFNGHHVLNEHVTLEKQDELQCRLNRKTIVF